MTEASHEEIAAVASVAMTDTRAPVAVEVVRRKRSQSFLIAVGSLVLIFGVGLVVMFAGSAIAHAFDHAKHVDMFAAFHNKWVVGVLLGIAVLWLVPPYPWGKRTIARSSLEQPAGTAGGTGDGGLGVVAVQLEAPGPGAVPRPAEDR